MNDLFSNSFKKNQAQLRDVEAGQETMNLDKFFEDVENVKDDMKGVETLYKKLQDSNEECKTVHNAKKVKELRAKMDGDVGMVLKRVKIIKQKLEALEKANANSRNVPGCGPGSSTDRTRSSVVSGLGKKLKDLMDSFQGLRARMNNEYKETVERRSLFSLGFLCCNLLLCLFYWVASYIIMLELVQVFHNNRRKSRRANNR